MTFAVGVRSGGGSWAYSHSIVEAQSAVMASSDVTAQVTVLGSGLALQYNDVGLARLTMRECGPGHIAFRHSDVWQCKT
jgi:hypothetical protein